jgi:hypothetical protein
MLYFRDVAEPRFQLLFGQHPPFSTRYGTMPRHHHRDAKWPSRPRRDDGLVLYQKIVNVFGIAEAKPEVDGLA